MLNAHSQAPPQVCTTKPHSQRCFK